LLETVAADDSSLASEIAIHPDLFAHNKLYLMRDAGGKFWIIELRFIDVFNHDGEDNAFIDFGFVKINSIGGVDIPQNSFNSAPLPSGDGIVGGIRYHHLMYGDWLVIENPENYTGPDHLPPQQVSFGDDPSYGQLSGATDGVIIRYAGEHFEDNITSADDLDTVFGNPPNYSSIGVRIDAGRDGITFVKLAFKKSDRKYAMNPLPENALPYVDNLKHNNVIAIFDDSAEEPDSPAYLARVIRHMPADDPYANFEIALEIINFTDW